MQQTATDSSTLQHTAAHCRTLQRLVYWHCVVPFINCACACVCACVWSLRSIVLWIVPLIAHRALLTNHRSILIWHRALSEFLHTDSFSTSYSRVDVYIHVNVQTYIGIHTCTCVYNHTYVQTLSCGCTHTHSLCTHTHSLSFSRRK